MSTASKATEQEFPQRLPRFERGQVPDPKLYFDCLIAIVEPNGTRGVWVSNGAAWVTLAAGGSAVWGGIGGTLSAQSDLNTALNGKQATLVSGTNIKTVNGTSLLGAGDVVIGGSAAWGGITGTLSSQSDLQTALNAKQATLVSGTNIKTINGSSILGSGDLVVSGGAGDMVLATVQTVTGAKTFGTIGGAVGKLILAGSTSGSSILNAAAIAGATTVTLPGATTTLVGVDTTDTMTNKTVTALIMGGITTVGGAAIYTSNVLTVTANAATIDVTKPMNSATNGANTTLSFSAAGATDQFFGIECINSDGANYRTWTIPSSNSAVAMGLITTFVIGPGGRVTLFFRHLGAGVYDVFGDPVGDRDITEEAIASATTTNIGGTYSRNASITGTTPITGFGTIAAGVYRRIRFTGALTLTQGAALLLPGRQSIVTVAGDSADALSLGSGNWIVFNYSRVQGNRLLIGATISGSRALTAADFTDRAPTLFPVDTSGGAVVLTLNTGIILPGQRAFFQRRGANTLTIVAGTGTISDPNTLGAGALVTLDIVGIVGDPLTADRGVLV